MPYRYVSLMLLAAAVHAEAPVSLTSEQDRQRLMELLKITSLRRGAVPKKTPKVKWEVTKTSNETEGGVEVVKKELVGHVDNSSYPEVTVDIQLTLATPAAAKGPVPVILQFGFPPGMRARIPQPPGPGWQQLVLEKGWGYAILVPNSVQADNGAGLTQGIIGLVNKGQPRKVDDWGVLRAWAWGASRALDYFESDKAVDAKRVGLQGHSRYGKATAVAMAYDARLAVAFVKTGLLDGDVSFRQHSAGHTPRPNWPVFLEFAGRYFGNGR